MEAKSIIGNTYPTISTPKSTREIDSQITGRKEAIGSPNVQTVEGLKHAELQGHQFSISEEQLIRAIDKAIKAMQGTSTSLNFSIHDKTHQIMVKVINTENGEVIREIPPEKNLDFLAKVWEMAGLLIDERR